MDNVHSIELNGWKFGIVKKLNFSLMDAYEIVAVNEHYFEIAGGPYLTESEAVADLESAAQVFLETNDRP